MDIHSMKVLSETCILIVVDETVQQDTFAKLQSFVRYFQEQPFQGLIEVAHSYTSISVEYNPLQAAKVVRDESGKTISEKVCSYLGKVVQQVGSETIVNSRIVEIPVVYGGEEGPDLQVVAEMNELTEQEVIEIHTSRTYFVHMLGFAPGFPYLGGLDERIAAPRKATPRARIEAGSVGIAGNQTGVYPFASPGGWQIIGRTDVQLFNPEMDPPTLLQAGDRVQFVAVSKEEFTC